MEIIKNQQANTEGFADIRHFCFFISLDVQVAHRIARRISLHDLTANPSFCFIKNPLFKRAVTLPARIREFEGRAPKSEMRELMNVEVLRCLVKFEGVGL